MNISTLIRPRIILVAAMLFAIGCGSDRVTQEVFGDNATRNIVENATKVTAYRIEPPAEGFAPASQLTVISGPVEVGKELQAQLSRTLVSENSYQCGVVVACGRPTPGVWIRLERSGNTVDVLICFDCEILAVYRDSEMMGSSVFFPSNAELTRIMKKVFPDDEVIQSLSNK